MKENILQLFLLILSPTTWARQVPVDASYGQILSSVNKQLKVSNPDGISDAMFGLLVRKQAAAGQGRVTDTNCLQKATADRAFTNAEAADDVNGMMDALVYRALERNTGGYGQPSNACTSFKAFNAEIEAVTQHQDPAMPRAIDTNRFITLKLAKQIDAIGGDPQRALMAGSYGVTSKDIQDAVEAVNGASPIPTNQPGTGTTQNSAAAGAVLPPPPTPPSGGPMAVGGILSPPAPPAGAGGSGFNPMAAGAGGNMPLPTPPSPGVTPLPLPIVPTPASGPMAAGAGGNLPLPPPPPMGTPGAIVPQPLGMTASPISGQGAAQAAVQGNDQGKGQAEKGSGQGNGLDITKLEPPKS